MNGWINWKLAGNPLNWLTVGLMAAFFAFALRETLRLFEGKPL